MKKTGLLAIMLLCMLVLTACGGSTKDVPLTDIALKIDEAIGNDGNMSERNANYLSGMMGLDADSYVDFIVKTNTFGTNFDEYGIFKGADKEQAESIASAVNTYLNTLKNSMIDQYTPEEVPKVENAECKINANYVIFAILSDETKEAAFKAFDDCLK